MSNPLSNGIPPPPPAASAGERRNYRAWLLILTEHLLRRGSLVYFRRRPTPVVDLEAFYASDHGVEGWDVWYASRGDVQLSQDGLVSRVLRVTRAETGERRTVHAEDFYTEFALDLGLKSPCYVNRADVMRLVRDPLQAWVQGDVDPNPHGGELSRVTGVRALIFQPLRFLHTRLPRDTPDPLVWLLTRRMQYQREMPRAVWKEHSRTLRWTVSPTKTRGITSSVGEVPSGAWWDEAQADSHGTPMPRPPTQPKTVDPRRGGRRRRAANTYFYEIIVGTRQVYRDQPREYFVLWKDNRRRAADPQNGPLYVTFGIEDATWEQGAHFEADVPHWKTETLPKLRSGDPDWSPAIGTRKLKNVSVDDTYERASISFQGNVQELLRTAAKLGTSFHKTVTHLLLSRGLFSTPLQCGWLGVQHMPPSANACNDVKKKIKWRTKMAQQSWAPSEAFVPVTEMSNLCVDQLLAYYAEVIGATNTRFVYTEYPVRFSHLLHKDTAAMYETNVDAVLEYEAPPSTNSTQARGKRCSVVEFKSLYGEKRIFETLPDKSHVAQAMVSAYMFEENTRVKVDRVTLIYVTRAQTVEVYDYPFDPPNISWQRDCVLAWAESVAEGCYYVDAFGIGSAQELLPTLDDSLVLNSMLTQRIHDPEPVDEDEWTKQLDNCYYKIEGRKTYTGTLYKHNRTGAYLLRWPEPEATARVVPLETVPNTQLQQQGMYLPTAGVPRVMDLAAHHEREYENNAELRSQINRRVREWCEQQNTTNVNKTLLARQLAQRFGPSRNPIQDADTDATTILVRAVHRGVNRAMLRLQKANPKQEETLCHHQQRGLLSDAALHRYDAAFDQRLKDRVLEALEAARMAS